MEYTIDAKGKKLGRIATEAATLLMGKNSPDFTRNTVADVKVNITNASKLDADAKKMDTKLYNRYTGFPGGLRTDKMLKIVEKKGMGEIIKKAVHGMLPSNKLRAIMMKNLIINE
ncbi:MAG: 50S ribosomal protein L13 [Candidatus Pacebacteria bacterium]|nr:50S ribosomal protein L13 [Candidatus Paceibacterota bacterium]